MGSRVCFGKFFNDHNCTNCILLDMCKIQAEKANAVDEKDDVKMSVSAVGRVDAPAADVSGLPDNVDTGESVTELFDDTPDDTPEEFNPEIHSTDDNGNPVYNKDGSLRKKRGRKPL